MRPGWAALALVAVLLGAFWARQPAQALSMFDQPFYLGIAHDLVQDGRFTDGFMFARAGDDGTRPAGMRFGPLYPALVAATAELDPGVRRGMDCVVGTEGRDPHCPSRAASLRGLQWAALCGVYWLVWWMGGVIGGPAVAWLGLLVGLGAAPLLLASAGMVMTEIVCLGLTTGASAAGVAAWRAAGRARAAWCGLAGAALGLAVLTRPGLLCLLPLAVAAALAGGQGWRASAGALALGAGLVLAPWLARNWLVLGQFGLTRSYASHTLAQRIAFDMMDRREYALAYVCWLPDGRGIGSMLAGAHACDRFGWDDPTSFYRLGMRHMVPETLAASGGYEHHLGYLLHHYVFRMMLKHLLVSVPLALRGAYVSHWWGLVLFPLALGATLRALGRGTAFAPLPFLIVALPAWAMLAFNAAVAVNQVRYNLMLVPAYAVAGGLAAAWVGRRAAARAALVAA